MRMLLILAEMPLPDDANEFMIPVWLATLVVGPLALAIVAMGLAYVKDRQGMKDDVIKAQRETIEAYKENVDLVTQAVQSSAELKGAIDALTKTVDKLEDR